MKLDITKGIQQKGFEVAFDLMEAWGEDRWNGDIIRFVCPVSFSGTYMLVDETVIVRGVAHAKIESPCARCLEPALTVIDVQVEEAFVREHEKAQKILTAQDDQYIYSGHELELDEAVRTALLLELPSKILCKKECKGLCPQCGVNLNVIECSCQKEIHRRNPFTELLSLLDEDEEV